MRRRGIHHGTDPSPYEEGSVDGAVVARCEGENSLVAESFIATDRDSLLRARGSKYAPVSSCTTLGEVLRRPGRYVFVGTHA